MNPWRWALLCVLMLAAMALQQRAHAAEVATSSLDGDWLAPAEDADDVDAIVTLSRIGPNWVGRIKAILEHGTRQKIHDDTPCTACQGPQHGQPYKNLQIIWGMQPSPEGWSSGQILDPGDGRVYQCAMHLSADGQTLQVTAYKGLRLLGHTMVWQRS